MTNRANAWNAGATIYMKISGAAVNTQYTLKYKSGAAQGDACHTSPTGNFGTATTDGGGGVITSVNTTGFGSGTYTNCPDYGTGAGQATNHRDFAIN